MLKSTLLLFASCCCAASVAAPTENIPQLAASIPDLSTLVSALVAGKLTDALSASGPFTVFAPTNEAFAKLPAATLKHLLDPANIKELDAVLEYHVISGAAIFSKDLKPFQMVKTLEGDDVKIVVAGRVLVNTATVTKADNAATNGVVHIIDQVLVGKAGPPTPAPPTPAPGLPNIVALALADPDLTTLVTALKAADLVSTLSGPGPFNVFTPTNNAFAALPAGVLANLLKPENKAQLVDLLKFHVSTEVVHYPHNRGGGWVPQSFPNLIVTLAGKNITAGEKTHSCGNQGRNKCYNVFLSNCNDKGVKLFDASSKVVTQLNTDASNGILHRVDTVLMPNTPKEKNIVQLAQSVPTLSTLVTAVIAANLTNVLSYPGPWTVFAPNNAAFAKLPAATLAHLLDPANEAELYNIIALHVVSGDIHAKDLKDGEKARSINQLDLVVKIEAGKVFISSGGTKASQVIAADNDASNGVVHIVDTVLLPAAGSNTSSY